MGFLEWKIWRLERVIKSLFFCSLYHGNDSLLSQLFQNLSFYRHNGGFYTFFVGNTIVFDHQSLLQPLVGILLLLA